MENFNSELTRYMQGNANALPQQQIDFITSLHNKYNKPPEGCVVVRQEQLDTIRNANAEMTNDISEMATSLHQLEDRYLLFSKIQTLNPKAGMSTTLMKFGPVLMKIMRDKSREQIFGRIVDIAMKYANMKKS